MKLKFCETWILGRQHLLYFACLGEGGGGTFEILSMQSTLAGINVG